MLTRRRFVQTSLVSGAAAYIGSRGRENSLWAAFEPTLEAVAPGMICLSSNENPLGPGAAVLDAVKTAFGPAGATPGRYSGSSRDLIDAIAKKQGVKPENIVLGCGSTQILRSATHLFTAKDKALVGTIPTYEECAGYAEMMGHPVRPVALDSEFKIDLDKFAAAAKGAGLVFYCNPNNPTATYVGARATREFLARVSRESPDTTVLVDEAYFDYVTDPDHDTHIPIAVENPRVLVARTFSKAYGMAGLRIGYAVGHPETIKKMAEWDAGSGTSSLNVLAMRAAIAAIQRDPSFVATERQRNKDVRDFTMKWFADRGMKPTDSQANFMFVNIGRPAKDFREACKAKGVLVARDFPPFEKTHCRISYGTMDEMKKAVTVFGDVLAKKATAA
ncbi:MAG TPA: aminotransferase class I/II-fold pyridoxal phosphate-dependent enzyme [Vicinamibacterales bacterium]|jgi:histidinol-phosphate aminotransferase|nr:aminotransferase class I/II-fold pyridoxal phosphate-dependent enzyme [Vicinamibacterales bacterium]